MLIYIYIYYVHISGGTKKLEAHPSNFCISNKDKNIKLELSFLEETLNGIRTSKSTVGGCQDVACS